MSLTGEPKPESAFLATYADRLLDGLGFASLEIELPETHPAEIGHESGLHFLTGRADQETSVCPLPIAASADATFAVFQALSGLSTNTRGSHFLNERASLMGLKRQGRMSAGGSCRLIETQDGRLAVNLARPDDWQMLPAWLEVESNINEGDWHSLESILAGRFTDQLATRARLMGLPISVDQMPNKQPQSWFCSQQIGSAKQTDNAPLVLDLSGLWAGPLCTHLLHKAGARIIKIESPQRPDGAREGNADFYRQLNADKECLSLDLKTESGIASFEKLLSVADLVIESSRPRAMQQLGVDIPDRLRANPGLTWLSITAYGNQGQQADWLGFGDDVGVAAGLSRVMEKVTGDAVFCGDAIADPLTGIHAALVAWASLQQGGGRWISLSMKAVTEFAAYACLPWDDNSLRQRHHEWSRQVRAESASIPVPRQVNGRAHALGEDTESILSEL